MILLSSDFSKGVDLAIAFCPKSIAFLKIPQLKIHIGLIVMIAFLCIFSSPETSSKYLVACL
jgi:hypothetical protein